MTDHSSLSDYLLQLRRGAPRDRLFVAVGLGAAMVSTGAFLGQEYASVAGLGCAVTGVSAWALLNQMADSLDNKFETAIPGKVRRLRLAGVACLGIAALGTLLVLTSFFFHFVLITKGM